MTDRSEKKLAADYQAALDAWIATGAVEAADHLAEIENDVIAHLDIPLDQTEQGMTPVAAATINAWLLSFSGS